MVNRVIMTDWKETTLGEVAKKIAMGPFGSNIKVETFLNDGVPVISGAHLQGLKLEDKDYNFISEEHAERLKNSLVYRGDVIFTHAGNIGQVAFIPSNSKYEKYILSQRQFFLRCDLAKILPEYVTYFFKTRLGQHKLLANANQVGVPSIAQPSTYLKSISILLPSVEEQKEIAGVLGSLDDKIELLREENKTLEATAQTIFKEWFVNFNFPNAEGKPYKSSGGKMIDSELGEIPEGWRMGKIKDFGKIVCGKTPSKDNKEYFGGKVPFIKIPDMHGQVFINRTEDWLTEDGANSQRNKYIPANSICVSCIATVGLVSITSEKSQTNQQINSIIPKKKIYLEYLFLALRNIKDDLLAIGASGSATLNINTTTFSNINLLLPGDCSLGIFHQSISPMFQKLNYNNLQIQTLSTLRDTLLPKLMSGELRVTVN